MPPAALPRPPRAKVEVEIISPTSADYQLIDRLRLIAAPMRLMILRALAQAPSGELHVKALRAATGITAQPVMSHELALLRLNGLVARRVDGRFSYYSVDRERLREVAGAIEGLGRHGVEVGRRNGKGG